MRRLCLVFVVLISQVLPGFSVGLAAAATEHLVISEVQTASKTNASSEFVELYNPTSQSVDLASWVIQYQAATATSSPTTKAHLSGTLPSHQFYLVATKDISTRNADLSEGLSATAGSIILTKSTTEIDRVGWGKASHAEKTAATGASAGGSIERIPGAANANAGNAIDTDDNFSDFALRAIAEPQSLASAAEAPDYTVPVIPANTTPPASESTSTAPGSGSMTAPVAVVDQDETIEITELFIDPASPQVDSKDEYVELHNYGTTAINLAGFQLQCGSNYRDHYTLPSISINPGQYLAVYAIDSKLSLTNTGGGARLLSPSGATIDEAALYETAKTGNSWAAFEDGWAWTTSVTPAASNIYTAPAVKASTAKTTSSTATKSSTAKASTAKTTTAAKKTTTKTAADGTSTDTDQASGEAKQSVPVSGWLLAGLGIITIGYAIYECRHYIHNFYELARRKLGARKTNRQSA